MKKKRATFTLAILLFVIALAASVYLITFQEILLAPLPRTTSTRTFDPPTVSLNKPVTVNLDIDFETGTPFYDVVEYIPTGFDVAYDGNFFPRPDLAPNAYQFTQFSPNESSNLSYVLIPDPESLCPAPPQVTLNGIYLAPPGSTNVPLGSSTIGIQQPRVFRTLSSTQIPINQEVTVYLYVFPGCLSSYTLTETVSPLTITDHGAGTGSTNQVIFSESCTGPCPNKVYSYRAKTISSPTFGLIQGNYPEFIEPFQNSPIEVTDRDCTAVDACIITPIDCQNYFCNAQSTLSCYGSECLNTCTGRPGFYCGSSCNAGDSTYLSGNASCENSNGPGSVCCQDLPSQSCEALAGVCVLDENPPLRQCPPGFTANPQLDVTCNDGEIQTGQPNYQICCIHQVCGDGTISGTEQCEDTNLNGETCTSLGRPGGTLSCDANCNFDLSGCDSSVCSNGLDDDGDGEIDLEDFGCQGASDNSETDSAQCGDGIDNDGDNDIDQDDGGCGSWGDNDEANCLDGVKNGAEQCDGTDFGGATCVSLGYQNGALNCTSSCTIDSSSCGAACPGNCNGYLSLSTCGEPDVCGLTQTCFWNSTFCGDCQVGGSPAPINLCNEYTPYGQTACEANSGSGPCGVTNGAPCHWCSTTTPQRCMAVSQQCPPGT